MHVGSGNWGDLLSGHLTSATPLCVVHEQAVVVFPFCRVLRLSDCAVSADCLASVGSACPSLEELRYRTASASYSPERVTARSELVYNTHIMRIVQGAACTLSACALVISAMCCRSSTLTLWLHLHCHE